MTDTESEMETVGEGVEATGGVEYKPTRDELRSQIFNGKGKEFKSMEITLNGAKLEMRQPSVGALLDFQTVEDPLDQMVSMMSQYVFVPGTDIKVFTVEDREIIAALPYNEDFQGINDAIAELMNIDVEAILAAQGK